MGTDDRQVLPVTAGDGTHCEITLFPSPGAEASPVVLCLPAMGVPARSYEGLAMALAMTGLHVITADLRGTGLSSVRASRQIDFGYHEMLTRDLPAIVARIRSLFPDRDLYLLGHSLGGQLSALYAASRPAQVAGLILVATGSVYWRGWDFPMNLGILAGTQIAGVIASVLGYFPGKKVGFAGLEGKRVMRDWARTARTGRYRIENDETDYEVTLQGLRAPVLAIAIAGDAFAPERAVRNLCNKLKGTNLTHARLASGGSGVAPHFSWLKQPGPVIGEIDAWLAGARTRRPPGPSENDPDHGRSAGTE